jgi:hypothetical protein
MSLESMLVISVIPSSSYSRSPLSFNLMPGVALRAVDGEGKMEFWPPRNLVAEVNNHRHHHHHNTAVFPKPDQLLSHHLLTRMSRGRPGNLFLANNHDSMIKNCRE